MSARYSWLTVAVVFGSMSFAVPRFGLIGAAGAILPGYSTSLLFAASARRTLGIPPAERRGRFWLGLVHAAPPEEDEFLQRFFAATQPWLKRRSHHKSPH